jgi:hypothetical protein
MRTIKCDISTVTQTAHDTLYINIEGDQKFDLKDFLQLKDAAMQIGDGQRFHKPIVPTRFFSSRKEAEDWVYAIKYDLEMSMQFCNAY